MKYSILEQDLIKITNQQKLDLTAFFREQDRRRRAEKDVKKKEKDMKELRDEIYLLKVSNDKMQIQQQTTMRNMMQNDEVDDEFDHSFTGNNSFTGQPRNSVTSN